MSGKKAHVVAEQPEEPAFLRRIKQQIGYKEPTKNIADKRAQLQSIHDATGEDERDRDDLHGREEDRPQIVQLKEDDLSEEQVMQKVKEDNEALEKKLIEEGKITFKKPTKRKTDDEEGAETSDKKQSKQQKFEKKNPTAGTQNTRLLSFGEDEEED